MHPAKIAHPKRFTIKGIEYEILSDKSITDDEARLAAARASERFRRNRGKRPAFVTVLLEELEEARA